MLQNETECIDRRKNGVPDMRVRFAQIAISAGGQEVLEVVSSLPSERLHMVHVQLCLWACAAVLAREFVAGEHGEPYGSPDRLSPKSGSLRCERHYIGICHWTDHPIDSLKVAPPSLAGWGEPFGARTPLICPIRPAAYFTNPRTAGAFHPKRSASSGFHRRSRVPGPDQIGAIGSRPFIQKNQA